MLTKILFTAAVIVAVMLYLRTQGNATTAAPSPEPEVDQQALQRTRNWVTLAILLLLMSVGGLIFYYKWVDDHRLVIVRVVNSTNDGVTTYSVVANTLHGRTFITDDGRTITLADVERMEVVNPDD